MTYLLEVIVSRTLDMYVLKEMVLEGPAIPLRQWMQPARPRSYSVKIYLDEIDNLVNYESILI